jgi:hypothetical protein
VRPSPLLAIAFLVLLGSGFLPGAEAAEGEPQPKASVHSGPACLTPDNFFAEEVWTKVALQSCLKCHKAGGDAEESELVLQDPARDADPAKTASLQHNYAAFAKIAQVRKGEDYRLLLKATGGLAHEGEEVLKRDSTGYRILAEFVRRVNGAPVNEMKLGRDSRPDSAFFDGIVMLDDRRLLRRLTLSLGARLPDPDELATVEKGGLAAVGPVLDKVMMEEAFYDRLAEAFNDIFLTRGYGDGAESALSYNHFSTTRHWTQKHNLDHIEDEKARRKARYKLADDYREALLREPMELIKHIVRNDRPFTEILTADYIMVSPYTSRGYGIFEEIRGRFTDPENPFEYIPVRLAALKHRDGRGHQKSETGFYPHAGMISTFQYLRRYPTTETNRNRLRARMYYQHFLGIDVLELAARVTDAAAASAKYEIPTMQAPECVVCHKTLDPVSSLFQDYYSLEGVYGPRKDGWFKDMYPAGLEGEDLPEEQLWRSLQWLGERTVKDQRFATTMVEHVYYVMTGRKVLLPPKGIDDPLFAAKQRAYLAHRKEVDSIAARFREKEFNLKEAFKAWAASPFYRADAIATAVAQSERLEELADVGVARLLGPEQIERKITAIFGTPWKRLTDSQYALLYGGIDSEEVTERASDPSGAMGAIQRTMSNEVACKNVATDFSKAPSERRLFPRIEPEVMPGETPDSDQALRKAIVHLHELVLGRYDTEDSPEVARTYNLFAGIVADAQERDGVEKVESYYCRVVGEERFKDPKYTVRAWRGVVTYLLRQREFLYE